MNTKIIPSAKLTDYQQLARETVRSGIISVKELSALFEANGCRQSTRNIYHKVDGTLAFSTVEILLMVKESFTRGGGPLSDPCVPTGFAVVPIENITADIDKTFANVICEETRLYEELKHGTHKKARAFLNSCLTTLASFNGFLGGMA